MHFSGNPRWRRFATIATLIGLVSLVGLGAIGHPVRATWGLSLMLFCLGLYRLIDRDPQAWLAVRSWGKDCLVLFTLSILLGLLAPYGGFLMPMVN